MLSFVNPVFTCSVGLVSTIKRGKKTDHVLVLVLEVLFRDSELVTRLSQNYTANTKKSQIDKFEEE